MPRIAYEDRSFSDEVYRLIAMCNEVIGEYQRQGFDLTLRQLYYQLVSRDIIPNSDKSYKRLGNHVNNGRMAGLIDWNAIVDRGRNLQSLSTWGDPSEILYDVMRGYRIDRWDNQSYRLEVWVEKEALIGVVARACQPLRVPFYACKGYNSQSEQWAAAQRLADYAERGQIPVILHLGDHDASGIDMTRDLLDRFEIFAPGTVEVERLALNFDQVQRYNPPPNPAKQSDSRFAGYAEKFGRSSWELDALPPTVIAEIIENAVLSYRDEDAWDESAAAEQADINLLSRVSARWEDVTEYLNGDAR